MEKINITIMAEKPKINCEYCKKMVNPKTMHIHQEGRKCKLAKLDLGDGSLLLELVNRLAKLDKNRDRVMIYVAKLLPLEKRNLKSNLDFMDSLDTPDILEVCPK